jgi:Sap, sulfolipid-1-addressing protein
MALAIKDISQLDPSLTEYVVIWIGFALVSLLPLGVALLMLVFARERALRILEASRAWLERRARSVAAVIMVLLAAALLRNGITGLT